MSIVSAFNDIAVAQGGTADTSGTLVGAIDALNDALAGSPQEAAKTIEGAIELLGENIGGSGGGAHAIEAYKVDQLQGAFIKLDKTYCYPAVVEQAGESQPSIFAPNYEAESIDSALSGSPVSINLDELHDDVVTSQFDTVQVQLFCHEGESVSMENISDMIMLPDLTGDNCFIMPSMKVAVLIFVQRQE